MSKEPETKTSWKHRLRHELLEYWMTVLYLALYFGVFTIYRRLILAHYQITYLNYGIALIQALVLAKVILLGDLVRLGRSLEHRPLIVPTLFRSAMFTLWVALFIILEHTLKGLLRGDGLAAGFKHLMSKGQHELLASTLVVFFTFIPFFALKELNRVLGTGRLWTVFFRGPMAGESRLDRLHH